MYNSERAERTKVLLKIDRNGSKHFQKEVPCGRCGGSGKIEWSHLDNQICWGCLGSGTRIATVIERTPEYEAVLEAKRQKKAEDKKRKAEAEYETVFAKSLTEHGFTDDCRTYLFLGNTFEKKEEIKEVGGKFDYVLGWHIDHAVDGFELLEVTFEREDFMISTNGKIYDINTTRKFSKEHVDYLKKQEEERLNPTQHNSQYIGKIKERLKGLELTVTKVADYRTHYSYYGETNYIYIMEDSNKNIFYWKTTSYAGISKDGKWINLERGDKVVLDGTVKDHKEYEEDKQTVLTRCTIKNIVRGE